MQLTDLKASLASRHIALLFPHTESRLPRRITLGWSVETLPSYSWRGLERPDSPIAILQYTVRGRGVLQRDGVRHLLEPGQAFLVEVPDDHHYYLPAGWEPWEFIFLCFDGSDLLAHAQWVIEQHGPVFTLGDTHPALQRLITFMTAAARGELADAETTAALLYPVMMAARREADAPLLQPSPSITRAMQYAVQHYPTSIGVEEMAEAAGLSRAHFCRRFAQEIGIAPHHYLTQVRLERACSLLRGTRLTIEAITGQCGYADAGYFGKVFLKMTGITPSAYRQGTTPIHTVHLTPSRQPNTPPSAPVDTSVTFTPNPFMPCEHW